MLYKDTDKPFINLWFGNFFEPAFNSKEFVEAGVRDIAGLGFLSIQLDSKSWADFFDRYEGKEASDYVAMQEYMMARIKAEGLTHNCLAIYLNGDNLYPGIRFSPAVIGEGVTGADGKAKNWYKYWSDKAQASMLDHLKGLFSLYGENYTTLVEDGKERRPVCTMWDPVVAPSFDEDGKGRFRTFLSLYYKTPQRYNETHGTGIGAFEELSFPDCWCFEKEIQTLTPADFEKRTPLFWKYADTLLYKAWELVEYFKAMQEKIHGLGLNIRTMPNLSQWGWYLNISPTGPFRALPSDLWDTARRGVDPYALSPYVDDCTFMTVPITAMADPCAYASSCQNSMIRMMNPDRDFTVGFYVGRYLYNDIYATLTPCEIIGTAAAAGASGYSVYGYCGLDDGGVMHKLKKPFRDSLRAGNLWAQKVLPKIKGRPKKQAAVLFPTMTALLERFEIEGNAAKRQDLLGWYKALCDCGVAADVIDLRQVEKGLLDDYHILVLPADSLYDLNATPQAEEAIKAFVRRGGVLFSGVSHPIPQRLFGVQARETEPDCVRYKEGIILLSPRAWALSGGEAAARYETSGETAILKTGFGEGTVYTFGFPYGWEYAEKETAAVPARYGNREFYPLCTLEHDPFKELLLTHITGSPYAAVDIEVAEFESGTVIVNHTSYPYDTAAIPGRKYFQIEAGEMLLPHSAVYIEK